MTDTQRARYVALFAAEARSLLGGVRHTMAAWFDAPADGSYAEEVFRVLHTVKGMSGSLAFDAVTELTHATESELSDVRTGVRVADRTWLRQLERGLDDIASACEAAVVAEGGALASQAGGPGAPRIVRVDLDRLDALFSDLGGLVTARQELERQVARDSLSPVARAAAVMAHRLDRLQDRILHVRLAPLTEVFERLPSQVRDLARQLGKEVTIDISGDDLEVDRTVLDQLPEPLMHLLRNALDHGIETPEARRALGKRPAGRILIRARRDRDAIVVELTDDGGGIDRERVARKALEQGILEPGSTLSDDGLLSVLVRPGFSTAESVSDVSGRGVGLDVVLARLHQIGAALSLTTVTGKGTVFTLRLPMRLGIVPALVTGIGEERYVMPLVHVAELLAWDPSAAKQVDGRTTLDHRGESIPVVDLRRLLMYRGAAAPARRPAVLFEANGQRVALLADSVHGQVDAVVQPIERTRGMPRWITGAAVLESGRPALLLDLASVV